MGNMPAQHFPFISDHHICCQTLANHVHSRILYLASLSSCEFFQVFFSVLPFDCDHGSPRTVLTDCILEVEYGPKIISSLRQLPILKTIQQPLQRRQQKDIALNIYGRTSTTWLVQSYTDMLSNTIINYGARDWRVE
jgi:hypothetical protein